MDKQSLARTWLDSVDSTQAEARRALSKGAHTPFWVIAKEQTAGRGRSGRVWLSAKGNYSASLAWPMPIDRSLAPCYSLVIALALTRTFEGLGISSVEIKWPNDVLIHRKKISGILLEAEGDALLIGVGVNLIATPNSTALDERALAPIALQDEIQGLSFEAFHQAFETQLIPLLHQFENQGFQPIREWIKPHVLMRETMAYESQQTRALVKPLDLGEQGQLIVEQGGRRQEIFAGDLLLLEE